MARFLSYMDTIAPSPTPPFFWGLICVQRKGFQNCLGEHYFGVLFLGKAAWQLLFNCKLLPTKLLSSEWMNEWINGGVIFNPKNQLHHHPLKFPPFVFSPKKELGFFNHNFFPFFAPKRIRFFPPSPNNLLLLLPPQKNWDFSTTISCF